MKNRRTSLVTLMLLAAVGTATITVQLAQGHAPARAAVRKQLEAARAVTSVEPLATPAIDDKDAQTNPKAKSLSPEMQRVRESLKQIDYRLNALDQQPLWDTSYQKLAQDTPQASVSTINRWLQDIDMRLARIEKQPQNPGPDISAQDMNAAYAEINIRLSHYKQRLDRAERARTGGQQTGDGENRNAANANSSLSPGTASDGQGGNALSLTSLPFLMVTSLALLGLLLAVGGILLFLRVRDNLSQMRYDLGRVASAVSKVSTANAVPPVPAHKQPDVSTVELERLTQKLQQEQQRGLQMLSAQMKSDLAGSEKRLADSLHAAVEQLSDWSARTQLRGVQIDGDANGEQAGAQALLEQYQEQLRTHTARVEPLTTAVGNLAHYLQTSSGATPGLISRVQKLYHEIGQFEQFSQIVDAHLYALQRGSVNERRARFQDDLRALKMQMQAGMTSPANYVKSYIHLLEKNFPAGSVEARVETLAPVDMEQLKQLTRGAGEFLMDWYSNFSQLQSQLRTAQSADATIDREVIAGLSEIQRTAHQVLNHFDIQPEEIEIGLTVFDRFLHELSMPRMGTPYPPQTIVEVQRAGFRRLSSGEVLRRPQVVVASSGVS